MQLPLDESTYLLKFRPGIYEKAKAVFEKVEVVRKSDSAFVDVLRIELNLAITVPPQSGPYGHRKEPEETSFDNLIILAPKWFVDMIEDCEVINIRRDISFLRFYNLPSQKT